MKQGDMLKTLLDTDISVESSLSETKPQSFVVREESGERKALVLYNDTYYEKRERELWHNFICGAPDDAFVWPETRLKDDSLGYVFPIQPSDYVQIKELLSSNNEGYKSFGLGPMLTACLLILRAYKHARKQGLSLVNLDQDFYINLKTGDVLIYGFPKVSLSPNEHLSRTTWMAPEIVDRLSSNQQRYCESAGTLHVDLFLLGVILFEICVGCHPFHGQKYYSSLVVTPETESSIYGKQAVFIFDPYEDTNRPVYYQNTINQRWLTLPDYVRDAFCKAFSKELIHNPESRTMMVYEWEEVFNRLASDLVMCPSCGQEGIYDEWTGRCSLCGKPLEIDYFIKKGRRMIPVVKGKRLSSYDGHDYGIVVTGKNNPHNYGIKNLSHENWVASINGVKHRQFSRDSVVPIKAGVEIETGEGRISVIPIDDDSAMEKEPVHSVLLPKIEHIKRKVPIIVMVDLSLPLYLSKTELEDEIMYAIFEMDKLIKKDHCFNEPQFSIIYFSHDVVINHPEVETLDSLIIEFPESKRIANVGRAFHALNNELNNVYSMYSDGWSYSPPIILFFSTGRVSGQYSEELLVLKQNKWFKASTTVAIKLNEAADSIFLKDFCGDIEGIINLREIEHIHRFFRIAHID